MKKIILLTIISLLVSTGLFANVTCGTDPCDVPCDDCVTITADAITESGSAPFSIVYDAATNGANTQTVAVVIQTPDVPPCASVDFSYTVDYTIDPSTPFNGSSWTSEASFEIQDLAGTVLDAQGPNLPGSANNNTPVNGSTTGTPFTTTAGAFSGGIVVSVEDSFNDANADGTFSGMLNYTFVIDEYVLNDIQPIMQACDDGDACTNTDMEEIFPCSTGDIVCTACAGAPVAACAGAVANIVQACDDGNPCTENDMEEIDGCDMTTVCVPCAGTAIAACTGAVANIVQACDDGDPCTENDMEEIDGCDMATVCVPCAGTPAPACSGAVANIVQACDDGDPCTENDMEEFDGCDMTTVCVPCAGMVVFPPDPTFTIPPTVLQCGGPVALNPVTPGGVFTGSGAGLVIGGTSFDSLNASPGVTYTLTYTVSTPGGCMDSFTATFMVVNDCDADGGSFPSGN